MRINEVINEGLFNNQQSKVDENFKEAFLMWQRNGSLDEVESAPVAGFNFGATTTPSTNAFNAPVSFTYVF